MNRKSIGPPGLVSCSKIKGANEIANVIITACGKRCNANDTISVGFCAKLIPGLVIETALDSVIPFSAGSVVGASPSSFALGGFTIRCSSTASTTAASNA